jgi:thiol-disulfide isomerase/thioredoxin
MSFQSAALLLAWIAIVILAFALAGLLRSVRALVAGRTPHTLRVGPAPGASLAEIVDVAELGSGRPTVLLFADESCSVCKAVFPKFNDLAETYRELSFGLMVSGETNGFRSEHVVVRASQQSLFDALAIRMTPFALSLNQDGTILEAEPAGSNERLESMVRRLAQRS